jgi:putative transposase
MTSNITNSSSLQSEAAETAIHLLEDWFDPIEVGLREQVREFIQATIETELEAALCRPRYGRRPKAQEGHGDGPSGVSGTGMATERAR